MNPNIRFVVMYLGININLTTAISHNMTSIKGYDPVKTASNVCSLQSTSTLTPDPQMGNRITTYSIRTVAKVYIQSTSLLNEDKGFRNIRLVILFSVINTPNLSYSIRLVSQIGRAHV